jgi:phytoene synthase
MTGERRPETIPSRTTAHGTTEEDWDHIHALVKAGDQDRYWGGLFLPRPARDHIFALYAFNIELARIGEQIREPFLGEIRLQWWRDALAAPPGAVTGNPVADTLAAVCAAHDLPIALLGGMIDARAVDVHREPALTMDALHAYLHATAGAVFRLGAWIAGARNGVAEAACKEAAIAWGLTGLMRALPLHAARGQRILPADFLRAFGVEAEAVLRGEESDGLKTALGVLREQARGALAEFRRLAQDLPPSALPVFLPLTLVPPYLRSLEQPSHRPLTEIAQLNPLGRYVRIWLGNLRGSV